MDDQALVNEAIEAFSKGDMASCDRLCRKILESRPDHPDGLHILGLAAGRRGDLATEVRLIGRAAACAPDNAELHNNLGTALQKQGKARQALAAHRKAIALKPRFHEAFNNLGTALNDLDRLVESEQAFERAIELAPENPGYINNLALCLHKQGCSEKAAACLQKTIHSSGNSNLHYTHGLLLTRLGDNAAAIKAQLKAIELDPRNMHARLQLVLRSDHTPLDHANVTALQEALTAPGYGHEDRMLAHFALGRCHDEPGHHEVAFGHFRAANRLMAARRPYKKTAAADQSAQSITAIFSREFISKNQLPDESRPQPLFILGMSRSGKTLLERMLAMHPDIHRGGELFAFPGLAVNYLDDNTGGFTQAFAGKATPELLQAAAGLYTGFIERISADARYVTDTLNQNTSYLGLIATLFPGARFIHIRRDPLDTLVTMYFKWFGNGAHFAYRIEDIRAAVAKHDTLMAHWKQVLPERVLELHYEDLVSRPGETLARAANYCGLPVSGALRQAWQQSGLHPRDIGRGRAYRHFIEKEASDESKS